MRAYPSSGASVFYLRRKNWYGNYVYVECLQRSGLRWITTQGTGVHGRIYIWMFVMVYVPCLKGMVCVCVGVWVGVGVWVCVCVLLLHAHPHTQNLNATSMLGIQLSLGCMDLHFQQTSKNR